MPAHRKYFNLPEIKVCPECSCEFPRPMGYANDRWHKAELCSLSCASKRGARVRSAKRTAELSDLIESHIDRSAGQGPGGECWQWTGCKDSKGYGRIGFQNRSLKAHRLALFGLADINNDLMACHKCDNPSCVRPDHLFAGTGLENTQDKMHKGRHWGNHRLTEGQVRAIIADQRTHKEIAEDYVVSPSNVGMIKQRLTWKDA